MSVKMILAVVVCWAALCQAAEDVYILDAPQNQIDKRNDYTNRLLTEILDHTKGKYGPYRIDYAPGYMQRDRLLAEMKRGEIVNITAKATRPDWEESDLHTIYVPVDKGITEYRMFVIRKEDQEHFNKIRNVEELMKLVLGVGNGWSTREIYRVLGFNFETGSDWEGLYQMLNNKRFDYFPRALSEIFVEFDDRHEKFPDLAIENSIMLYFPLPKYFFVSPQFPKLAKRVEDGFKAMIRDGSFNKLFLEFHEPLIKRADFCGRRIFRVANPLLSVKTPLDKLEYWYDPNRAGIGRGGCVKPKAKKAS